MCTINGMTLRAPPCT